MKRIIILLFLSFAVFLLNTGLVSDVDIVPGANYCETQLPDGFVP